MHRLTMMRAALLAAVAMSVAATTARAAGGGATTELVSATPAGVPGDGESFSPSISGDGRYVAFVSTATDLLGPGGPGLGTYLRDRKAGRTVALGDGFGPPVVSRDGRFAAYNDRDGSVAVREIATGKVRRIASAAVRAMSADGRYVAFVGTGAQAQGRRYALFVRDMRTGETTLESRAMGAGGAPRIGARYGASLSADGRYIAFDSFAPDLVPGDANGQDDVFVRDRRTGETVLASVAAKGGGPGDRLSIDPFVSDDGRTVAFTSFATDLVGGPPVNDRGAYVRDLRLGRTTLVDSRDAAALDLSPDGRRVLLSSFNEVLVPRDTNGKRDVFLYDRPTKAFERVNLTADGRQTNGTTDGGRLAADGRVVAFVSTSDRIEAPRDLNHADDVFVRVLGAPSR